MSVSIHFQAIIPVDGDTYRKHKAVWDACEAAGVPVPAATVAFFGADEDREVTASGIRIDLAEVERERRAVLSRLAEQHRSSATNEPEHDQGVEPSDYWASVFAAEDAGYRKGRR